MLLFQPMYTTVCRLHKVADKKKNRIYLKGRMSQVMLCNAANVLILHACSMMALSLYIVKKISAIG